MRLQHYSPIPLALDRNRVYNQVSAHVVWSKPRGQFADWVEGLQ